MKRRSFIHATGLATVGTALTPQHLLADNLPKKKPFTIILGSGFAGLGAAKQLKDQGYDYVILEARNRKGGRVFTHYDSSWDGLTVELGAEWIGASHTEIKKFNNENQVGMEDHTFNTRLLFNDTFQEVGEWNFDETHNNFKQALLQYKNADEKTLKALDKLDYWRYLNQIGLSEKNIEIREFLDSTDFGESIRNVSAFAALSEYAFSSEKNEMDLWTKGGNSKMIDTLVNYVGDDKIKLNHAVTSVTQKKKKLSVTCANGAVFEGDRIICTIPTYAISKIKWEPGFCSTKKDALDALQYCRIIKTSILFSERFWKDESFDMLTDTLGHYFFHSTKLQPGKKGVLTSYAIGDKAQVLSKMTRLKKIKELTHCLQPAFGNIENMALDAQAYYWGNDQHTMGAYAIYDTNQWFSHRLALMEPENNIFFAGEHLAEWQGFMEGAFVSGMDAAKAVIKS
jgi:monoamine oxidase